MLRGELPSLELWQHWPPWRFNRWRYQGLVKPAQSEFFHNRQHPSLEGFVSRLWKVWKNLIA